MNLVRRLRQKAPLGMRASFPARSARNFGHPHPRRSRMMAAVTAGSRQGRTLDRPEAATVPVTR
jgi:hypothetical protein